MWRLSCKELLGTLHKDPNETRRHLSEALRKLTVLRVNEKKLSRRYVTLVEQEQHLRKENNKLKDESGQMQASVTQRLGYLQRYKVSFSICGSSTKNDHPDKMWSFPFNPLTTGNGCIQDRSTPEGLG